MANTELLKKIKTVLTLKPELWDQHQWARRAFTVPEPVLTETADGVEEEIKEVSCGTAMCVAGWACFLSGEKFDWTREADIDDVGHKIMATFLESGETIENKARELLDISREDAGTLFYGFGEDQTLERLDELIEHGELEENKYF